MGILAWILFGLLAGAIAELLVPGNDPGGGGIVGAFIGGWIGLQFGWGSVTSFDLRSLALAVLGAILLLIVLRALRGGSRRLA
jgi:uncharacterized membrane protein YeaQ/YmgE (transglycosylase-associated protein family)